MKDFGVSTITTGIENFSDETIKLLNKGHKLYHSICFLKWCKLYQIKPFWLYLIDVPGESSASYIEGLKIRSKRDRLHPPKDTEIIQITRFTSYYNEREIWNLKNLQPDTIWSFIPWADQISFMFTYYKDTSKELLESRDCLVKEFYSEWIHSKVNKSLKFSGNNNIYDNRIEEHYISITDQERELLILCDTPQNEIIIRGDFKEEDINKLINLDLLILSGNKFVSLVESLP